MVYRVYWDLSGITRLAFRRCGEEREDPNMPLAQLAEPWPKMELVQLETEVRREGKGRGGTGTEVTLLK